MYAAACTAWFRAGVDAWSLGAESSVVAALRLARIAAGGKGAAAESQLMVSEKVQAALELQARAMTGRLGATPLSGTQQTLDLYRGKVAANCRRLTR